MYYTLEGHAVEIARAKQYNKSMVYNKQWGKSMNDEAGFCFVLILASALTFCWTSSDTITPEEFKTSNVLCEPNGGVMYLELNVNDYDVTCKNGGRFTTDYEHSSYTSRWSLNSKGE